MSVVPGKVYCFKIKQKSGTTYSQVRLGTSIAGSDIYLGSYLDAASFTETVVYFVASSTTVYITVVSVTSVVGRTFYIDTVSMQETIATYSTGTAAFDGGWYKTNATITRETGGANVKAGSLHAAKVAGAAADGALKWSPGGSTLATSTQAVSPYAGRTVVLGAWVKCATAGVVRLSIADGSGTSYSGYHSGSGSYEWLEVSRTVSTSLTQIVFACNVGTATAWFCQPMLAFAPSLGAGNYQPWRGVIPLVTPILSARLAGSVTSTISATTLNVAVDTLGRIAKGNIPALRVSLSLKDSGQSTADASINLGAATSGIYELTLNTGGLAVSPSVFGRTLSGTVNLNASGSLPLALTATGTNTATAAMIYTAVEV